MAVIWYGGNRLYGLFSDTKPTNASDGSTFYESDTGSEFVRISGVWTQREFDSSSALTNTDTSVIISSWDTYLEPKQLTDLKIDGLSVDSGLDIANSSIAWDSGSQLVVGPPSGSVSWGEPSVTGDEFGTAVRGLGTVAYGDCLYFFGGNMGDGGTDYQLTHRFNVEQSLWQSSLACTGTLPAVRWTPYVGIHENYFYVFGGQYGSGSARQDTHRLNLDTLVWSNTLPVTGTPPNFRYMGGGFIYNGYLWIFGGYSGGYTNDLHRLNLNTLQWSGALTTSGTPPTACYGCSFTLHDGYGYVFGGYTGSMQNVVNRINLSTLAWSGNLSVSGTPPSARWGHCGVQIGDYMYIAHGATAANWTGQLADVHRFHIPTLTWSGNLATYTSKAGYLRSGVAYKGNLYLAFGLGNAFTDKIAKLTIAAGDITLVTDSWEASANNPTSAYCVLKILPLEAITLGTDLKAYVSMDDGTNYEEITGLTVFQEDGSYDFVKGTISGLTARDDKTMKLKITTHNSKQIQIAAQALGVGY